MKGARSRLAVLLVIAVAGIAVVVSIRAAGAPTAAAAEAGGALPPLAWTTYAGNVSMSGALLHGEFNPRNHRTVIQFQYGRTKAYGRVTPPYPEEEWFGEEINEEEEFTECLRPGTTYHYRILAKSKIGTAYGRDRTFRTRASHGRKPSCL